MEGIIKVLKTGFGFIEESTTQHLWFFTFRDLMTPQTIKEGFKVRFERKNIAKEFEEKLNEGFFKDSDIDHRKPNPRKALGDSRGRGRLQAPAASRVEIIAEPELIQEPLKNEIPVVDCGTF